uniref:Uncharacterized protein n=1 Tax=Magallana gigas TaxID=29159 RepID=A0A8W8KBE5_MAGGI
QDKMLLITPGDSYLSSRSYSRRGFSVPRFYDDTYVPRYVPSRQFLDTTGEENSIRKSVNRELMLTSHFVDDAYDLASSSHKRDEEVLKHASQAIVDTELYHNPRAAVASRRARSQPPQPLQVTQSVYRARASVPPRGASPPPRSYVRRANREYLSRGTYDDTDGLVKKPKNDILSWKHRLESRVAPSDLLFTPKVYANVRSKLRDVQEKMDRHRQLMDRYLDAESLAPDTDIKTKVLAMYSEMEERDPLGTFSTATTRSSAPVTESSSMPSVRARTPAPSTYRYIRLPTKSKDDDYKPMSDVRRRVRRVICKNRKDPLYFK